MARSLRSMAGGLVLGLMAWSGAVADVATARAEPSAPAPKQYVHHCGPMHRPVEVNTASVEELKSLPGVTDHEAALIVENRPYKRSEDLVERHVLPQELYDRITFLIFAVEG